MIILLETKGHEYDDRGLLLADNPMACIKVKFGFLCNGQLVEYLKNSKKKF